MSNKRTRDVLDVEDDNARQQRIQTLLEHTDASARTTPHAHPPSHPPTPPSRPHAVPRSSLISRAEAFLPRLAAANAALAATDPAALDIEHLDAGSEGPHIEMNLGLGVFEQRRAESESSGTESSDSDSDSDAEDDGDASSRGPEDAEKYHHHPGIVVLENRDDRRADTAGTCGDEIESG